MIAMSVSVSTHAGVTVGTQLTGNCATTPQGTWTMQAVSPVLNDVSTTYSNSASAYVSFQFGDNQGPPRCVAKGVEVRHSYTGTFTVSPTRLRPIVNFYKDAACTQLYYSQACYRQRNVDVTVAKPAPTIAFSANPTTIQPGGSSTLQWFITNYASACPSGTSCTCTGSANWNTRPLASGSTQTQTITPTATDTYTLQCTGPDSASSPVASATVTVVSTGARAVPAITDYLLE